MDSGTAFPSNPQPSQQFYRTDLQQAYIYVDGTWGKWPATTATTRTATGTAFPSNPLDGQEFFRTDTKILSVYDAAASAWISTRDGSVQT